MDTSPRNVASRLQPAYLGASAIISPKGYYVLDPRGVIRHKWVGAPGEKAIDTALKTRINEAETNGKKST